MRKNNGRKDGGSKKEGRRKKGGCKNERRRKREQGRRIGREIYWVNLNKRGGMDGISEYHIYYI